MDGQRPTPEDLLKRVQEEEARQSQGKLKVFFGATAGVGKTFAMLAAAQQQRTNGVNIVVGWIETHGRADTEALIKDLETLPPRVVEHRGTTLHEFDLDAAIARHPQIILIDELAHTNAPGSRHPKRWQDVLELLNAGISVYTTLNVQHLESLNDVVTQITRIRIGETVPDSILERADDLELIDLPPDDLLQRLKEGKVYMPELAQRAIENFFRKGNLIALRELALRRTAEWVDRQMELYRREYAVRSMWPAAETIMVCVNMKPRGPRLVRAARRMAAELHAKWLAVYVQTPRHLSMPEADRERVNQTLLLAEQLGAETATVSGEKVAQEILSYARSRNVTKIIVGKPVRSRWKEWVFGSVVSELVRNSGETDIYVITGEAGEGRPLITPILKPISKWPAYTFATIGVVACTAVAWLMSPYFDIANLIMVYLLGVVFIAARYGRGPSSLASFLSVAAFDFFFIPPYFTFHIGAVQYLLTFAVMLIVSLLISGFTVRTRQQAEIARQNERRTAILYALSRDLATQRKLDDLARVTLQHVREIFGGQAAAFIQRPNGDLMLHRDPYTSFDLDPKDAGVVQWVFEHSERAGMGTNTLPGANGLFLPLIGVKKPIGVLIVRPAQEGCLFDPDQIHLLEMLGHQMALAITRVLLAAEAQQAHVQAETERTRNAILSAVSHDFRTPLATITGAASGLLEEKGTLDTTTRQELVRAIYDEAHRLDRLVKNLLEMMRLEAGAVQLKKEWHPFDEIVGATLSRLEGRLTGHTVETHFPPDLPLVHLDAVLMEQVLINLLDNALKYAPPSTSIELSASVSDQTFLFEIADRGPGIPPGDEERIFDKFYRAGPAREGGVGLGLTICRGIIAAHGGHVWAENRPEGGTVFRFTLPLEGIPPKIEPERDNLQDADT
jgi:two-component system sensor histidine kinase KdpD